MRSAGERSFRGLALVVAKWIPPVIALALLAACDTPLPATPVAPTAAQAPTATTGASSATAQPAPTAAVGLASSPVYGNPAARAGHELVYHAGLKMVLLVNGDDAAGEPDGSPTRIWGWDGHGWRLVADDGPPVRSLGGLTYDADRNTLVMYGGSTENTVYDDTWEWDGVTWQKKQAQGPGLRHHIAMAYDAAQKRIVLYGGNVNATADLMSEMTFPSDTWAWDGATWQQVDPVGFGPRYHYAMTYDSSRRRVLIFGGSSGRSDKSDLRGWDGTAWTGYETGTDAPSSRTGSRMAFDEQTGTALLFGGYKGGPLGDTWAWDGTRWSQLDSLGVSPDARSHHAMAYDKERDRIVLFGGAGQNDEQLADTWEWDGKAWSKASEP